MPEVVLRTKEREALEGIVKHPDNSRQYRRAQGLLWLATGESVTAVAQRLRMTRQTLYNWVARYQGRREERIRERLDDHPRSGRPPTKREQARPVVAQVLANDPREYGYRATVWTAPLLCEHLRGVHGIEVSPDTLGVVIRELGYRWKRPRYRLKRRPQYWRQAKGGSSGA